MSSSNLFFMYYIVGETVKLQASSTVVAIDTAFELVCTVEGTCDLSTIIWNKDGQALELGSGAGEEAESVAVVISSAKHHHGGQYCCSVENKTSCIDIAVIGKPNAKNGWEKITTYHQLILFASIQHPRQTGPLTWWTPVARILHS